MDPSRRPAGAPDVKPEPAAAPPPPQAGDEQDPSSQFAKDGYIKFASPRRPLEAIAEAASSPTPTRGEPKRRTPPKHVRTPGRQRDDLRLDFCLSPLDARSPPHSSRRAPSSEATMTDLLPVQPR